MIQSENEYHELLKSLSNGGLWYVDSVSCTQRELKITGWAKSPDHDSDNVTFLVNGKEFENIEYPKERNDVGNVFFYSPHSAQTGFCCRINLKYLNLSPDDDLIFQFVNKSTKKPFSEVSPKNFYYSQKGLQNNIPLPPEQQRVRVHGSNSEFTFLFTGYQIYNNCKSAIKRKFNRDFDSFNHILDWGCGCGRSGRFFNHLHHASFTGADIDEENIAWCKQNLKFGNFFSILPFPPSPLPSSEYDLIIGISVFTHLDEATQYAWLKELHRISADDAVILMSVHGDTAICYTPPDLAGYNRLEEYGFLDNGHDPSLDGVINLKRYYRGIFHKPRYIKEKWGEFFDIEEIIPGFINNHQDLVIMKK